MATYTKIYLYNQASTLAQPYLYISTRIQYSNSNQTVQGSLSH